MLPSLAPSRLRLRVLPCASGKSFSPPTQGRWGRDHHPPSTTYYLPPLTTYHLLPTTSRHPPHQATIHHSPFTTYYLPLTTSRHPPLTNPARGDARPPAREALALDHLPHTTSHHSPHQATTHHYHSPFTTYHLPHPAIRRTIHHSLLTTYYLLLTTYYLPPTTTHHPPPPVSPCQIRLQSCFQSERSFSPQSA